MNRLILVAGMVILLFAFESKHIENKMQSFRWINGLWTMSTKRGVVTESWVQVNDSTMTGSSRMISTGGDTMLLEDIRMIHRNNDYYYCPTAHGQNNEQEIKFRITSYSTSGFVAENPEHDFPKRIIYELVNKDSITATVDGGPGMPGKRSVFHYSRLKN